MNKKLCKKLKLNPKSYELKHYKYNNLKICFRKYIKILFYFNSEGTFNKDYDRPLVRKVILALFNYNLKSKLKCLSNSMESRWLVF